MFSLSFISLIAMKLEIVVGWKFHSIQVGNVERCFKFHVRLHILEALIPNPPLRRGGYGHLKIAD